MVWYRLWISIGQFCVVKDLWIQMLKLFVESWDFSMDEIF